MTCQLVQLPAASLHWLPEKHSIFYEIRVKSVQILAMGIADPASLVLPRLLTEEQWPAAAAFILNGGAISSAKLTLSTCFSGDPARQDKGYQNVDQLRCTQSLLC